MNFNDYPEKLKYEEQLVLDQLILKMNRVIDRLDKKMMQYVREAKNADIAVNPDMYFAKILAEQGKKDTEANRKAFLKARDELYHTRLLLKCDDEESSEVFEVKVGLHSCANEGERFVIKWTMPLCQHYLLDNTAIEYRVVDKNKYGNENIYDYTLLAKNKVNLRFTHVKDAVNLFPGAFDDKTMKMLKGKGFFSDAFLDEMIDKFNPDEFDPNSAEKIISDEFLQELLERRSSSEFKNIVFSIQKKQGEIIQAPYQRNMIVQGCAGSGKSMIMLHRLPVLLYNHANSLKKTNLYVISPSQMYIQLAENMRYELEISDIDMGTIEDYYDYCISKYPGHKAGEYGRINWGSKLSAENERYIYSSKCVEDIKEYFDSIYQNKFVSLEQTYTILNITPSDCKPVKDTYLAMIKSRISSVHGKIIANRRVIQKYYTCIRDILSTLRTISNVLKNRKIDILRQITKQISQYENEISILEKELTKLDKDKHAVAIQNRKNIIELRSNDIKELEWKREEVEADNTSFEYLMELNKKIEDIIAPFQNLKNEFYENTEKEIYEAMSNAGKLIGGYYMISWEMSKAENKYITNIDDFSNSVKKAGESVAKLQAITDKYLNYDYYSKIRDEYDALEYNRTNAVTNAYDMIMAKIGLKRTEGGTPRAIKCSPYIYLQVLYQFQGAPTSKRESLLAIDEAQGVAPEEIRLLRNINGEKVVFNMFGDVYQHIEGTKGIDSWDEFRAVLDFDEYEMQENYRNASQITEYCNHKFGMKMIAINTPGKGVHELESESEFESEMISQLMGAQKDGLAAILVNNTAEAKAILDRFSSYSQKLNDMTADNFSIHHTRWNIINIDDAKGLEFNTVIVLSGRMSRNQKYIAYTRALEDLYVYDGVLDISRFEKKSKTAQETSKLRMQMTESVSLDSIGELEKNDSEKNLSKPKHVIIKLSKSHADSEVRKFFEARGFEVCDKRDEGGRLWVVGEKKDLRNVVNEAISKFRISGKYLANREIQNRNGWCTKTDK